MAAGRTNNRNANTWVAPCVGRGAILHERTRAAAFDNKPTRTAALATISPYIQETNKIKCIVYATDPPRASQIHTENTTSTDPPRIHPGQSPQIFQIHTDVPDPPDPRQIQSRSTGTICGDGFGGTGWI